MQLHSLALPAIISQEGLQCSNVSISIIGVHTCLHYFTSLFLLLRLLFFQLLAWFSRTVFSGQLTKNSKVDQTVQNENLRLYPFHQELLDESEVMIRVTIIILKRPIHSQTNV